MSAIRLMCSWQAGDLPHSLHGIGILTNKVLSRAMTVSNDKTTGSLRISGTLDIDEANALREALLDCFLQQPEVTVNLWTG